MKTISIRVDVGGSHISFTVCRIEEKKHLPSTFLPQVYIFKNNKI